MRSTRPRILVAEDEEPLSLLLRYNLEAEGCDVEVAARGDEAELTYILVLPRNICINDRDLFADPNQLFRDVHVYANDAATRRQLRAAVGRNVRVRGQPFAAHTGHHHAPLVMMAIRVTPLAPRR